MIRLSRFVLILSLTLGVCGCRSAEVIVDRAPPTPKQEPRVGKPPGDVFWMSGRWEWDPAAEHFFWVPGQWAEPRPGRIWQNAYWEPVEQGRYRWVPERWDRIQ